MQLTNRDIEILKFINEFGFCEIVQIEKKFGLKKPRCYQVMQRLIKANLVIHERVFHARNGVFYLTYQGATTCTDLPSIKNIPKDNYLHQLTIIEIYFQLMHLFPQATWISERRMWREKDVYSVSHRKGVEHLADGVLVFPDDKQVAIEVELSMKSRKRIEDIIVSYVLHRRLKEVWYFCSPEIIERVRKAAGKWDHVKIHGLS